VDPDLEFALSLADDADELALARFRAADLRVETKPDLTPVTEADRAVEERLRQRIAAERPGERVLGEELGEDQGDGPCWILDPIDGTRNYARGIPIWATLISFDDRVAVVSAPALGRRWWASRGGGAFANGEPIRVSVIDALEDATVLVALDRPPAERAFAAWHLRALGDFWAHMLVAEGAAEVAVDAVGLKLWDTASLAVIVAEAGGRFDGRISSNGLLHDAAVAELAP
jgi:histidinol-phosphatase